MSTITTILGTDVISTSRTDINTNFTNLNTDKIETSVLDTDTALAANSDLKVATQKAVKAYVDTGGNANASETVRGIVEEATDAEMTAGTATGATGAKLVVTPAKLATRLASLFKFGGTGADGALTITLGATNIDLAGAAVVTRNYTSISITGTGSLTFTNPHADGTIIILKSQGNVNLTSSATPMIDASGLGGSGGSTTLVGNNAPNISATGGGGSAFGLISVRGSSGSGVGGSSFDNLIITTTSRWWETMVGQKYPFAWFGGGGGGGGASANYPPTTNGTTGIGGRGGGCLIVECRGAFNFTTASGISVAGKVGGDCGDLGGGSTSSFGGGGGGAGGLFYLLYNTLTANTGTVTVTGGGGGTGFVRGTSQNRGGGGGASLINAGGTTVGNNGASGAAGLSTIIANTEFA